MGVVTSTDPLSSAALGFMRTKRLLSMEVNSALNSSMTTFQVVPSSSMSDTFNTTSNLVRATLSMHPSSSSSFSLAYTKYNVTASPAPPLPKQPSKGRAILFDADAAELGGDKASSSSSPQSPQEEEQQRRAAKLQAMAAKVAALKQAKNSGAQGG